MSDKRNRFLLPLLVWGVFGILTTEMGVIGILPSFADKYNVSISQAGMLVSLFALGVAIAGPTLPLLFSRFDRKKSMLAAAGVFVVGNIVTILAPSFEIALLARIIPAFFHPIYCSLALTIAGETADKKEAPKAVSKVIMGVSAGMVFGVPISSLIASATNLEIALLFFTFLNGMTFLLTLILVPALPPKEQLSYGKQLSVLKRPVTWLALLCALGIGAGLNGVYSYLAEFLGTITQIVGSTQSTVLFTFGLTSLLGNYLAGRVLSTNANKLIFAYPFLLASIYVLLIIFGNHSLLIYPIAALWGMLFGIGNNTQQYIATKNIPDAPEFANGLYLASGNLGTTIGTAVGGVVISTVGIQLIPLCGIAFMGTFLLIIVLLNMNQRRVGLLKND
ncbi:MFS transporter [Enterococcus sp. 669A]|uniref:MFS transporter n=1 Tax=Candidatus Enterococcus moelleringii TaxID=2815325 RepID=A0ABS3LE60_9ENTE|nr:MFS transporter [Enterococcus sp. 669A]MBO1307323.1 MFS transporter [Enterococcus sp. 669A]